jgi:hypothetical protein
MCLIVRLIKQIMYLFNSWVYLRIYGVNLLILFPECHFLKRSVLRNMTSYYPAATSCCHFHHMTLDVTEYENQLTSGRTEGGSSGRSGGKLSSPSNLSCRLHVLRKVDALLLWLTSRTFYLVEGRTWMAGSLHGLVDKARSSIFTECMLCVTVEQI